MWFLKKGQRGGTLVRAETLEELAALLQKGEVSSRDTVWTKGRVGWQPLSEVLAEERPQLATTIRAHAKPASKTETQGRPSGPQSPSRKKGESAAPRYQRTGAAAIIDAPGYFRRHWRGQQPLWQSFLINTLVLNATLWSAIALAVPGFDLRKPMENADAPLALAFMAAMIPLGIWQIVGIWRSAARIPWNQQGYHYFRFAMAARVISFVGLVLSLSQLVIHGLPFLGLAGLGGPDTVRTDTAKEESLAPFVLTLLRDGQTLKVSGDMSAGLTAGVQKELAGHPGIKVIEFNTSRGLFPEAQALARLIEGKRLNTHIEAACYSLCVLPYAAGAKRSLGPTATIGFHHRGFSPLADAEKGAYKAYLLQRGVQPSFVEELLIRADRDVWRPEQREIYRSGLANEGGGEARNSVRIDNRNPPNSAEEAFKRAEELRTRMQQEQARIAEQLQGTMNAAKAAEEARKAEDAKAAEAETQLLALPIFEALQKTAPDRLERARNAGLAALREGKGLKEAYPHILRVTADLYGAKLPLASDAVLIAYAKHGIAVKKALRKVSPVLCYDHAYVGGMSPNVIRALTPDLQERELALEAQILMTANKANTLPREQRVREDLDAAFVKAEKYHAEGVALAARGPTTDPEEQVMICDATIAIYEALVALPKERAGPVLRFIAKP